MNACEYEQFYFSIMFKRANQSLHLEWNLVGSYTRDHLVSRIKNPRVKGTHSRLLNCTVIGICIMHV